MSTDTDTPTTATTHERDDLTTYERYIRTEELLALQKPPEERAHPDELTFQVVHQTIELWWKMTAEQLDAAVDDLRHDRHAEAAWALRRAISAQVVVMQAERQLELVAPVDFLRIRTGLGDGSGAGSPGFRAILRRAPDLMAALQGAIDRAGLTLYDVYASPADHRSLYDCCEALVDFDEQFHLFRAAHLKLAERNLGMRAIGTGGTPMPALERTLSDLLFPPLWDVRAELLEREYPGGGSGGGYGGGHGTR